MPAAKLEQHYSVEDYLNWPDDLRCELIDGVIYDMSPAPLIRHQSISGVLIREIGNFIRNTKNDGGDGSGCKVFAAPIDVVLAKDSVVQPDIVIVCDPEKLANGKHVLGAPDAVVEILSKSTALKDRREKKALYQRAGVIEYLIIDPFEDYAEYYRLVNSAHYEPPLILGPEDHITFQCLPGFSQTLNDIFQ